MITFDLNVLYPLSPPKLGTAALAAEDEELCSR